MANKRGNGEGTISKRADGRWEGRISLGARKRKAFYGKTRQEVARQVAGALRDRDKGLPIVNERQSLGDYLEHWLEHSAGPSVRPSTFASYAHYVRHHLVPSLGKIPLARLTPQQVQAFQNEKLAGGLTPRTVQYMRAILRRALGQALKWGLVPRNVATLVDPPRVRRPEIHPLTGEQARVFLGAVRGDRREALYAVVLACGLRQGEALGLRWEDVDLEGGTLTVRQALQRVGGALRLVEPKTARSRRTLALPAFAHSALREHRLRQLQARLAVGDRWRDTGLVFTSSVGTPLDASNVTHRFQRLLAEAGLPRQRFHDLRHACASLLLAQGVHPRVVMETLGHSQISLTMNTYSHVVPSLQREAAERMDALLSGNG